MISELKRAFEIGFLLFLPFLIIDLVVASVLMSMGMMMLPPVVVSLPFKLIFFVLVDGWTLVRTLAAYRSYYRGRSAPWEAQALLRAEAAAGDEDLGASFVRMIAEFRYPLGGLDPAAVREIRRIKARVEAERIPRGADRALHVKLGPGGLSDVEWTIQLLQLQHAHAVPALRTTRTTEAMAAAVRDGLLPAGDAAALMDAWQLAGRIRNAIVLVRGLPEDTLPTRTGELTTVARLLGYPPGDAAQALEQAWRRACCCARTIMEPLFYG